MSTSKSLVLAFIWILLLSFIFILFVDILGVGFKTWGTTIGSVPFMGRIVVGSKSDLDALTFSSGTFGLYSFTGYSGTSVESDDGLLLVSYNFMYKWGKDGKAAYRTFTDTTWHFVNNDFPTFYKNYQDLNSLGTSLLSAFGYEKKQLLNQGDSVSFNRGYGFLFVTSIAIWQTYCFIVNAATPTPLAENASDYSAMLTFTKSSEQAFTITAAQRVNGTVIFIHG